ncbi:MULTISPECIES: proton-conducting transporter membrane subunit [unclassified Wenzhouxiangella]|uniref:proton-conducting transporter transmembrane domain-containing protein n=1 Tax=unclassified Wenzhouxiangella TaxID=2613841 RepID=UPI000E328FE7|nr:MULTISPECIES: proton-conducting transporter membrane subunit [unclassified Wenzhouxiangella]RFF28393.1 monovalent cation/H+ antiporter subunit D family protein [Wenzhouxiangella sp. 15181]RFP69909.1 monovalent cation/H+ antiporter subunit D family protein [Wenzhouxiangella sp. 15190]
MSPLTVILIPFAGAIAIALAAGQPRLRDTLGWIAAIAFFIGVVQQIGPVLDGAGREQLLWTILPGLDLMLRVEPLGLIFALVASTLWLAATLYAQSYMKAMNYPHLGRFFACYALALGATAGVAFADNLITLFIFYEILTISTYPLVTHSGNADARRGGRIYLGYLLTSSIGLLLVAILWTYFATGTVQFTEGGILAGHVDETWLPLLAGLFFFGIGKAALMPMHRWLPAAMVAPAPVSALLHAVAVVKAGVFTVLKVAVYVFGIDLLAETGSGIWISWFAAFTIIAASLVALTLTDLKARLAYSTVAQLSYVVIGAMVATPLAIIGAVMHLAMHAVAKITLFFGAGAIQVAHNRKTIPELDGLGRVMPWTFGAFTVGTLSIIGLPLFGGMWSKWYLLLGALETHQLVLVAALLLSSLLNILYLLIIPIRAFFAPAAEGVPTEGIHEAPLPQLIAMTVCAAGCIALFFWPDPLFHLAGMLVQ